MVYLKNQSRKLQMFITKQATKYPDHQSRLKTLYNKKKNLEAAPEFIPDLCVFQTQLNKLQEQKKSIKHICSCK